MCDMYVEVDAFGIRCKDAFHQIQDNLHVHQSRATSAAKANQQYITYGSNATKTFQCHLNFIILCSLASRKKRDVSLFFKYMMHAFKWLNLIKMCICFCWLVFVDMMNPLPIQVFQMILNKSEPSLDIRVSVVCAWENQKH